MCLEVLESAVTAVPGIIAKADKYNRHRRHKGARRAMTISNFKTIYSYSYRNLIYRKPLNHAFRPMRFDSQFLVIACMLLY